MSSLEISLTKSVQYIGQSNSMVNKVVILFFKFVIIINFQFCLFVNITCLLIKLKQIF